jgi:hypothetical protein
MKTRPLVTALVSAALVIACRGRREEPAQTTSGERVPSAAPPPPPTADVRDQPLVRVVQAIPEAPPADVYAGNKKAFEQVTFGEVTPYKPVPEEHFVLALKPAGQEGAKPMVEAKQGVAPGQRYTILSMPDRDGAAKITVVSDAETPPAAGKAKVRIIHAAPQAGTAELTAADETERSLSRAEYGSTIGYREVDPGAANVTVRPRLAKTKNAALLVEPLPALESGKVYTFVVAPGAEPGKPVEVIKIEDTVTPAADDGVRELFPTAAPATEREQSYEMHPDTDELQAPKETPTGK